MHDKFVELTRFRYLPCVTSILRACRLVAEYCESEGVGGSFNVCGIGAGQVVRRLLAGELLSVVSISTVFACG